MCKSLNIFHVWQLFREWEMNHQAFSSICANSILRKIFLFFIWKKNFLFKSFWTYSMRIGVEATQGENFSLGRWWFLQISKIFSSLCWWFPAAGLGAQMYSDSFFCQLPDMLFGKYFTNIFKSFPKECLKLQQFLVTNVEFIEMKKKYFTVIF